MKTTNTLPQSEKIPVGNDFPTSTRQASNLSDAAKTSNTSLPSPKPEPMPVSMPVGNRSLRSLTGKKLPTAGDARTTMRLVAASTLNWLLVRILYLEMGSVLKADGLEYYEIRLPTQIWEHDGKVFKLRNEE